MRLRFFYFVALALVAVPALLGLGQSDSLSRQDLRQMLVQLGYEVKDLDTTAGKEKYSFVVQRDGLNIPVAAEVSPNGNFIWLTVFCTTQETSGTKAAALLRKNAEIQPSQFYITKSNKLMVGLAIENRGVTNATLRTRAEKIVADVATSKDVWQGA